MLAPWNNDLIKEYSPNEQKLEYWESIPIDNAYLEKNIVPHWFTEWFINLEYTNFELSTKVEDLLIKNRLSDAIVMFYAMDEIVDDLVKQPDKFHIANNQVNTVLN